MCAGAWDATVEKLGPVNVLINNAGIGNEQDWNKTITVNLVSNLIFDNR